MTPYSGEFDIRVALGTATAYCENRGKKAKEAAGRNALAISVPTEDSFASDALWDAVTISVFLTDSTEPELVDRHERTTTCDPNSISCDLVTSS